MAMLPGQASRSAHLVQASEVVNGAWSVDISATARKRNGYFMNRSGGPSALWWMWLSSLHVRYAPVTRSIRHVHVLDTALFYPPEILQQPARPGEGRLLVVQCA